MSKKNGRTIPRKFLPAGSVRITKQDGSRVWMIAGKEYASKGAYLDSLKKEKVEEVTPE